ncbi:MAG: glycosyl hydrolase, partial [bacterium]|nr:glycosyl hydrolase [bacterium]
TWMHHNNIPAGEFYDISVDNKEPYNVYGGTQDDASVYGPATEWNPNYQDQWKYVWFDVWSGGDGCYTLADPTDPDVIYSSNQNGNIFRKNMRTGRQNRIRPRFSGEREGRPNYHFITPYIISPHNPLTLYHAGNYIFKSLNRGDNWKLISPDLTRSAIPEKVSYSVGGFAESPIEPGVLFAGTEKGAFWVTNDDGRNWTEHSAGLPNCYIRSICPSRFDKARVYVTLTGINYDDLKNYIYVSEDYGKNWRSIVSNLPDETAYSILEDPVNENILYAGLLRGVYISVDRGRNWSLLGPGMASMPISDLIIQEREMDLLVGTHGRGIFKMNIRPIHKAFEKGVP